MPLRFSRRLVCIAVLACGNLLLARLAFSQLEAGAASAIHSPNGSSPTRDSRLIRDPFTGRLFQQSVATIDVPMISWETRTVDRVVHVPQKVTRLLPTQQTVYTAKTEYVPITKLTGRWNPFRQPRYVFDYQPVTSWQPHTQTVQRAVTFIQMLPQNQSVQISQPVQRWVKQQQVAYREIPQPTSPPMMLATRQAVFQLPILGRGFRQPLAYYNAPLLARSTSTLRPVTNTSPAQQAAGPLSGTSNAGWNRSASARTIPHRDATQSGMPATVLR